MPVASPRLVPPTETLLPRNILSSSRKVEGILPNIYLMLHFVWPNERTKCRQPKTPFQLAKADTVRLLQLSPPKQWINDPSCCRDHQLRNPIRFIVAVISFSYKDYTVERSSTTEKLQTCGLRSNRYCTKTDAARNSVPIFR